MDPVVLFFALGLAARWGGSDLRLPEALYEALSIYLLLAIGLKGGVQLAQAPLATVLPQALAAIALSAAIPFALFPVLRRLGGFPRADAGAIAGHYGSVSVVTYAVALTALAASGLQSEPYLPVLVAVMEAPGIVAGILLARAGGPGHPAAGGSAPGPGAPAGTAAAGAAHAAGREAAPGSGWAALLREVAFGKSVLLLVGGIGIGTIAGPAGFEPLAPLFADLFKGVLALFLLEMGLVAGGRLGDLRRAGPFLVGFGIVAPVVLGAAGAWVGHAVGLSTGGTALLATLAASASYIAAPTAMRMAVPEANPALSIGLALGVTFPFNLALGIPLYIQFARWLGGG